MRDTTDTRDLFEAMLTGGHPNSLGRTVEVVDMILAEPPLLEALYQCYFSEDAVVRLRVSSSMKRICHAHPDWLVPYVDRLLTEISQINQASTQWTLAQLFGELVDHLTTEQHRRALAVMQNNLTTSSDWIVINQTLQILAEWAKTDADLARWLEPHLLRFQGDSRKSVAGIARKLHKALFSGK
ncbi:MAG: hypothetical protein SF029_07640 [bacterium]|nr:hypothetical protein [bacterium]